MSRQDHEDLKDARDKANARQVGGDHYKTGGIELWDLFGPESIIFYATRYLQRWRKKDGVRDLEKALHCVQKLREIAPRHEMRNVLAVDDGLFERWLDNAGLGADEKTIIRRLVIWWKNDSELEYAVAGIQYLIRTANTIGVRQVPSSKTTGAVKSKPILEMTDDELTAELRALEKAQSEATSWGAAVGVRAEYIQEIENEQHRRHSPKTHKVLDKLGRALRVGDPCTWMSSDVTMDVSVVNLLHNDEATVCWWSKGNEYRRIAKGAELRYDETRAPRVEAVFVESK